MKMKWIFLIFLLTSIITFAQSRQGNSITGKVLEKGSNVPLEYANIILFNADDSAQVSGASTNSEGIL